MGLSEAAALHDLSEAERAMIEAVGRGEPADLKRAIVRGSVLRELILETRPGWVVPPAGIRLTRVIVDGGLDLEGCIVAKPLLFWHSRIQGGGDRGALLIRDARLKRLGIHSCTIDGSIIADRVGIESGLFLGGGLVRGVLQIRGGEVTGALAIEGTEIGDGKTAVLAAGVSVSGPLILRRAKMVGEVALPRASIDAGIYAEDVQITHSSIALNAESARFGGDVLLERAIISGGIRLSNARIGGRFCGDGMSISGIPDSLLATGVNIGQGVSLNNAKLSGTAWFDGAEIGKVFRGEGLEIDGGETAINADIIKIGGNWDLPRVKLVGQLRCPGADINGQLRLTEARLYGSDLAIRGDGARIRGGLFLSRASVIGLVRFPAATFGNQFRLRGATLKVDHGAALIASGSSFERDVELNGGFQSVGAILLDQTRIHGLCDLRGSAIRSAALGRGGTPLPAPDRNGQVARTDELALSLVDAEVDRLRMPDQAEDRPRGIVDLSRAKAGSFEDAAAAWHPSQALRAKSLDGRDIDHLVLDGFTYEHLTNPAGLAAGPVAKHSRHDDRVAERRIAWLEGQQACDIQDHFKPQAWVELSRRLASQGYHEDARAIAIARRRREARSHSATLGQRVQASVLDVFALYGYSPWRTVAWMTAFVLLFAWMWAWAASHCVLPGCFDEGVLVVTNRDAYAGDRFQRVYPEFQALAYSLDLFVPFVGFGYEDHWRPNLGWGPIAEIPWVDLGALMAGDLPTALGATLTITVGGILYVLSIVEIVLGLVLTSLAVTGFTGILKGED